MVRRVFLSLLAFTVILGALFFVLPVDSYFPSLAGIGERVLIIYDEPNPDHVDEDTVDALMLRQLVGHFETDSIELVSTGEYKEGQAFQYSVVFYVGTKQDMPIPTYLLDDLFERDKTTVWLGANLSRMRERHSLDGYGLRLLDDSDQHATNRVEYKGKSLWKLDTRTFAINVINEKRCKVWAWATASPKNTVPKGRTEYGPTVAFAGEEPVEVAEQLPVPALPKDLDYGKGVPLYPLPKKMPGLEDLSLRLPWIMQGGNFWYIASNPFSHHIEGGAYLAFCDILHEIFRSGTPEKHYALVRIEDIHVKRNPKPLLEAADWLQAKGIPFCFTLIPVYINPETGERRYLSSEPRFLATVRGLIERGGIPILHGYTHQHSAETGVDYEFWSIDGNHAISQNSDYPAERIVRGLSECFLADIYPLTWTTPHYAASQIDYKTFRDFFTTALERRQPIDKLGSDQFFPYMILKDMHDQIIFPESLGYVQPAAGRDPAALIKDADNTLVVRDGWASFFFHTFLDLDWMYETVEGIEALGYEFVSLSEFNNKVRTKDTVIISGVGVVDLDLDGQYLHQFVLNNTGEVGDDTYSFRPVTGLVQKFSSVHPGEISVHRGVYTTPTFDWTHALQFRPVVSGITSPVAIFLLFSGIMIMVSFLVLWIFLLVRKLFFEIRDSARQKRVGS